MSYPVCQGTALIITQGRNHGASICRVEGIVRPQSLCSMVYSVLSVGFFLIQIFQNSDSDLMLARRIKRDVKERGRDVEGILDQASDSSTYSVIRSNSVPNL